MNSGSMPNKRFSSFSPEEQRRRIRARFWSKVDKNGPIPELRPDLGPCWLWTAATVRGYGVFGIGPKLHYAHRISYELHHGGIDPQLTIDHLCRTRKCVNPAHHEQVTGVENSARGESPAARHARKTHCPQGHPYLGSNVIAGRKGNGKSFRQCRLCKNAHDRRYSKEGRYRKVA